MTDVGIWTHTCASPSYSVVPVQPAAVELLTALSRVLSRWGRWYVFGAQAVIAYGVPRLSADVDVTVDLVPDEPERFAREMEAAGFALRIADSDFLRRTRVMPFVHVATAMPLDVVLAGSGLEDEFLDRARTVDLSGTAVPMIDREDLIIAKVLAGRPKDIDDARGVWRLHRRDLDAGRIRLILRSLEEALSQSDLITGFEAISGERADDR
ncbi:MAG: nucleotidyltransferase [Vicinamibacteria bacterium]